MKVQVETRPFGPINLLWNLGLNLLFPASCSSCKEPLGWRNPAPVCAACWSGVRLIQHPMCLRCGHPLYGESDSDSFYVGSDFLHVGSDPLHIDSDSLHAESDSLSGEIGGLPSEKKYCDFCLPLALGENPPAFSQARSIFYYEGTIRHLIHAFKYQGKKSIGRFLGRSILTHWEPDASIPAAECIVPVPVGIKKLRHREFNQSFVLAREIGKKLMVPVYPFALKRVKEVASQMKLSRQERLENIRDAFRVRDGRKVQSKRVLLVDDVFTTGATASECSRILLQHGGAREVQVLTLARSVLD